MKNPLAQLEGYLRALQTDLVERRLAPVVVILVLAAIGVPVAFTVTSSKAPNVPAAPAVAQASGPGAALTAAPPPQQASGGSLGKLHDPFAGGGSSAPAGTTGATGPITARTTAGGASGPAGAAKPIASTPTAGTHGSTGKPSKQVSALEARALRTYHVSYSFGNGTDIKTYSDAVRLDAVPSNSAPVAQWLGVTKDTRKAAFLLWSAASASGDGVCVAGQTTCQLIELQPGQTEFIDVLVPGAGVVQFELDLLSIDRTRAATAADALKAHMRQSSDGVKLLTMSTASALAQFEYSTVFGTLLPRASTSGATSKSVGTNTRANSSARPSARLGSHHVHHAHRSR
jgi:hypothetical protein